MDFFMVVIVVVSFTSTGSARPIKVHKRLNMLENRVNTLETRINHESDNTQEFYNHLIEINSTLKELEHVCQQASTHRNSEIEDTGIASLVSYQGAVERVFAAFNQEKIKIRSVADSIEKTMTEMQHNLSKETDQNKQAVINDYMDLKYEVQNINLTLIDIQDEIKHIKSNIDFQDEIQQYIRSDKDNTALLSAELTSNKENTALLSAELKELFSRLGLCPNLWSRYSMFCYRLFKTAVTYLDAKRNCTESGAYVVDVQNLSEQEFVTNLTQSVPFYWTSLTDIKTEGNWKWDRTNTAPTFLNWNPGQPDTHGDEDCVLATQDGSWHDYPCSVGSNFVCKKSL